VASKTADKKGLKAIERTAVALERLAIEYVGADTIHPNDYNPNRQSEHDFALLIRSMLEDGFTQPIVAQRQTREIIDGEHRWTGGIVVNWLRVEGKETSYTDADLRYARANRQMIIDQGGAYVPDLPVVFTDMSPEQMRIATLRHNRARGSEDIELTAAVMRDLQALGAIDWAQDSLMLDDLELNRLLEDLDAADALAGDDFTEGWEVDPIGEDQRAAIDHPDRVATTGKNEITAFSQAAAEQARNREEALKKAKSAEERETINRESANTFRVVVFFSGDEAAIVQQVLADRPADNLVAVARWALEQGWTPPLRPEES
jgi:ParB-like chromosome segregation protein Spo0J